MTNLLFILPFCQHDRDQAVSLLRWIKDIGPVPLDVALLYDRTVINGKPKVDYRPVAEAAVGAFRKVISPFPELRLPPEQDFWPSAPNRYFTAACRWINERREEYPSFWFFEPDLVPLKPHWWQDCLNEYEKHRKPHWGALSPWFNDDQPNIPQGEHLQGSSIYRSDVWALKVMKNGRAIIDERGPQYLDGETDFATRNGFKPRAFDVYLAGNMLGPKRQVNGQTEYQLAHRTHLLQHAWRSRNFREENGEICFSVEKPTGERTAINPNAVIFHGCKDDSLISLLRQKFNLPEVRNAFLPPPPVSIPLPKGVRAEIVQKAPEPPESLENPVALVLEQPQAPNGDYIAGGLPEITDLTPEEEEALRLQAQPEPESEVTPSPTNQTPETTTQDAPAGLIPKNAKSIPFVGWEAAPEEGESDAPPAAAETEFEKSWEKVGEMPTEERKELETKSPWLETAEALKATAEFLKPKRKSRFSYLQDRPLAIQGGLRVLGKNWKDFSDEQILEAFRVYQETGKKPPFPKHNVPKYSREQLEQMLLLKGGISKVRSIAYKLEINAVKMKKEEILQAILSKQNG